MRKSLAAFAFIFCSFLGFTQSKMRICATKTAYDQVYERTDISDNEKQLLIEALQLKDQEINKLLQSNYRKDADTTIVIPVVFHIVHQYGPENVPNQTVYATMALLNREYNKLNPGINNVVSPFKPLIAKVNIEFRLAKKDPQGNCTSGIVRYADPLSYCKTIECNKALKTKYTWPRGRYMNCFIVGSIQTSGGGTVQGFSHFPFSPYDLADSIDGNAMIYNILPTTMNDPGGHNTSVTTHEVGHWLGLYHTWGKTDNVALPENCQDDDEVGDTPNCTGLQSVCDLDANTCDAGNPGDTIDNAQNYMDYSHCYAMFTLGQAARMRGVMLNIPHRKTVSSYENIVATGADYTTPPSTVCKADFMPGMDLENTTICPGQPLSFSDISFHGIKQRLWTFEGATPATSTDSVPTVTYNQPGQYTVTLQVSDGTNTETITRQQYVTVVNAAALGTSYSQGFETMDLNTTTDFEIANPDNDQTFQITSQAGYSSSKSIMINNNQIATKELQDELISNTMNLSGYSTVTLEFKYAFVGKPAVTGTDQLNVWVSTNCGLTWANRKILKGSALKTASDRDADFYPTGDGEWKTATINLNTFNKSNFRFKLEWLSGGGNNVFVDNINMTGSVSINELEILQSSLSIVPNPSAGSLQLSFESSNSEKISVQVFDLTGSLVFNKALAESHIGENNVDLNLGQLTPGMYLLTLNSGKHSATQKLIIQ